MPTLACRFAPLIISSLLAVSTGPVERCFGQSREHVSVVASDQDKNLQRFLRSYVRKSAPADDPSTRYFRAFVDLNGDRKDEVIVYLMGDWWCGSGGCPTLILAPIDGSFVVISNILATRPPILVLQSTSHGWRNFGVFVQGGGIMQGYEAEVQFDGSRYRPLTPLKHLAQDAAGETIFTTTSESMRLFDSVQRR